MGWEDTETSVQTALAQERLVALQNRSTRSVAFGQPPQLLLLLYSDDHICPLVPEQMMRPIRSGCQIVIQTAEDADFGDAADVDAVDADLVDADAVDGVGSGVGSGVGFDAAAEVAAAAAGIHADADAVHVGGVDNDGVAEGTVDFVDSDQVDLGADDFDAAGYRVRLERSLSDWLETYETDGYSDEFSSRQKWAVPVQN